MATLTTYTRIISNDGTYTVRITEMTDTHVTATDTNGASFTETHAEWFARTRRAKASGTAICR